MLSPVRIEPQVATSTCEIDRAFTERARSVYPLIQASTACNSSATARATGSTEVANLGVGTLRYQTHPAVLIRNKSLLPLKSRRIGALACERSEE